MVNNKEKALALIEKELAKKDISHTENEVEDVLDALYDAYEADDTVPTQEAFAEQCANVEVGEAVLAMKRDPFAKRGKGGIVAICVGCILVAALIGGGIWYTVASQQQDDLAVESTVVTDTEKDDDAAETSEDDEVDESAESDGEETDDESVDEDDTSKSSDSSSSASTSSSSSGTTSSSSSSSSNSGSHSHNWVALTTTVHHDAVYETVYHSAVKETKVFCNGCGAQFDSDKDFASHSKSQMLQGNTSCGSYYTKPVVTQQAYTEQVLVTAAYDETVTIGYYCSTCGATK